MLANTVRDPAKQRRPFQGSDFNPHAPQQVARSEQPGPGLGIAALKMFLLKK